MFVAIKVKRKQFNEVEKQLQDFGWRWAGGQDKVILKKMYPHYNEYNYFYILAYIIRPYNKRNLCFIEETRTRDLRHSLGIYEYVNKDTIKVALTTLMLGI